MKILEGITPNSPKWDELRLTGIGSSDAAAIVGVSKYSNPLTLWKIKTGEIPEDAVQNPFTEYWRDRGQALEPLAKEKYKAEVGWDAEPAMVVHDEYNWMRASLDGLGDVLPAIIPVEIKCPGKTKMAHMLEDKVPSEYWPQLQHILMVTGADWMHLWGFDGTEGSLLTVFPDLDYQRQLFASEKWFWELVTAKIPPDMEAALGAKVRRKRTKKAKEDCQ